MKIHLISFDYWGYDVQITNKLNEMGHQAVHLKLSNFSYKYPNLQAKIFNFFSKIFLNKNIKVKKTEEYILTELKSAGIQDKIIVINPERISKKCHQQIKKYTKSYVAYLYDSIGRFNTKNLINGNIFDEVYTFDKIDARNHNIKFLPNYIHLEKKNDFKTPKHKIFSISSVDERYPIISRFVEYFDNNNIKHETIFLNEKKNPKLEKSVNFIKKKLTQNQIQEKIEDSEILLDVLRKNQTGLSFRIFDAMALDKKVITTNQSIKEYDFYNPNNILVIDKKEIDIPKHFLNTKYQKIPETIYNKYTLKNWINTILKNE